MYFTCGMHAFCIQRERDHDNVWRKMRKLLGLCTTAHARWVIVSGKSSNLENTSLQRWFWIDLTAHLQKAVKQRKLNANTNNYAASNVLREKRSSSSGLNEVSNTQTWFRYTIPDDCVFLSYMRSPFVGNGIVLNENSHQQYYRRILYIILVIYTLFCNTKQQHSNPVISYTYASVRAAGNSSQSRITIIYLLCMYT